MSNQQNDIIQDSRMDKYYEDQANSKENRGFIHGVFDAKEKQHPHKIKGIFYDIEKEQWQTVDNRDFQKIPKEEFLDEKREAIKEIKEYLKNRIEEYKLKVEESSLPTETAYYNGKVCSAEDLLFFIRYTNL